MTEDIQVADKDTDNQSPYKILKMVDGSDVLCKILQEYSDALVVETPMSVTKQQTFDRPDHVVEHTGLQRWINFTNDIKFVIDKQKILGFANLAPEVTVYYKMIAKKAKEEAGMETQSNDSDEEVMAKMRSNIDRLAQIMDGDEEGEDPIDKESNKLLH
tara:strand:- start:270 stop:746 length:477 start_codon:yes stop_codon:yes gene_type:complete